LRPKFLGGDGTSTKVFAQVVTWFDSKEVRKFDYGKPKNLCLYGSEVPPLYDFTNISTKTSIITGSKDHTCNTEAAEVYANVLNKANEKQICKVYEIQNFKH